jgi:hypothetical protein
VNDTPSPINLDYIQFKVANSAGTGEIRNPLARQNLGLLPSSNDVWQRQQTNRYCLPQADVVTASGITSEAPASLRRGAKYLLSRSYTFFTERVDLASSPQPPQIRSRGSSIAAKKATSSSSLNAMSKQTIYRDRVQVTYIRRLRLRHHDQA